MIEHQGRLYWTDEGTIDPEQRLRDGAIRSVPVAGGVADTLADRLDWPRQVATDGRNVYWVGDVGATLYAVPVAGGAPTVVAGDQCYAGSPAVDVANLYWAIAGPYPYTAGEIRRLPLP